MPETEGTKTTLVDIILAFLSSLAPNEWVPGMRSEPWGELLYGLKLGGWTEMGEANWDAHYPLFPDLFEAQPAILRWCLVRWDGSLCIHPEKRRPIPPDLAEKVQAMTTLARKIPGFFDQPAAVPP